MSQHEMQMSKGQHCWGDGEPGPVTSGGHNPQRAIFWIMLPIVLMLLIRWRLHTHPPLQRTAPLISPPRIISPPRSLFSQSDPSSKLLASLAMRSSPEGLTLEPCRVGTVMDTPVVKVIFQGMQWSGSGRCSFPLKGRVSGTWGGGTGGVRGAGRVSKGKISQSLTCTVGGKTSRFHSDYAQGVYHRARRQWSRRPYVYLPHASQSHGSGASSCNI